MKYYSELTKQVYDTEEQLTEAEHKLALATEEKDKKLAQKKEDAKKVTDAFKNAQDIYNNYRTAFKHYLDLRREFIEKYGYWHATYTNVDGDEDYEYFDNALDLIKAVFNA